VALTPEVVEVFVVPPVVVLVVVEALVADEPPLVSGPGTRYAPVGSSGGDPGAR
jgi:hypothetical protein